MVVVVHSLGSAFHRECAEAVREARARLDRLESRLLEVPAEENHADLLQAFSDFEDSYLALRDSSSAWWRKAMRVPR